MLILYGLGYAARFVHPRTLWWLQLVALGMPLYTLGVVAAGFAAAFLHANRLLLACLACGVFILLREVPWERLSGQAAATGTPLRVMSFNAKPREGHVGVGYSDLLGRERPDLLCVQEVRLLTLPNKAVESGFGIDAPVLAEHLGYTTNIRYPGRMLHHPVISTFEVGLQEPFSLGESEGPIGGGALTRTTFPWQGQDVALYNVHLTSYVKPVPGQRKDVLHPSWWVDGWVALKKNVLQRAAEAERLRQMIERETGPIILCGDLNATPDMWVYAHLRNGMHDAFRVAGTTWFGTFPSRSPFLRIDYVLVSREWKVATSRVIPTDLSDHLPVVAEIRL
jgi:endonuclease/exonuclease/phosphatase (EEP) superfamily protein YafD